MNRLIPIIVVAIVTVFVAFSQRWMISNFDYQCANCGEIFGLSTLQAMIAPHAMGKKLVKCPNCGKVIWATPVRKGNGS
jgi:DNA-directed RNA polymerase subunit RPC12/RpoP